MLLLHVGSDTVLCCSVILSEWMFELAAQLNAAKYGELLLLFFVFVLMYYIMYTYSVHDMVWYA